MALVDWSKRERRVTKRPLTYWEEYVATDEWYKKELVADIPEEEMHAALECEDFECDFPISEDGEEDGAESGSESDDGEEEEDLQWTPEGERGGEESDGESESGSVGEERSADDDE